MTERQPVENDLPVPVVIKQKKRNMEKHMFIRVKKLDHKALKVRRKRSDFDFDDD